MQLNLLDLSGKETQMSADIQWIEIEQLYPHPDNPRLIYKEEIVQAIASSIEKDGFQPCYALLVRPFEDGYQILSGHTRLKASQQVGVKKLPCWVKEMSDGYFCPFTEIANSLIFAHLTTKIDAFELYCYSLLTSIKIGFKNDSFIGECSNLRQNKANWLERYFSLDKLKSILSIWNMGTCPDFFEWNISPYASFFRVPFDDSSTNKAISSIQPTRDFDKEIGAICKEFDDTHTECVYFVQAKQLKLIKIGVTKNLKARLSSLNTGCPDDLKILKIIKGDVFLEKLLHEKFAHLRIKGEWFTPSTELLQYIDEV